ncbi:MAG: DNA-protecting protein DprA [Betaproteobacteria bacterium]|nr:DNA-protecting protein DprA [Betaproteobacteria bacterium]
MPLPPSGSEPEAWLSLDLISGLGASGIRRLLSSFGSPAAALQQSTAALTPLLGPKLAAAVVAGPSAERLSAALAWLTDERNHLMTLADDDYPRRLLETPDPPVLLYLKGQRTLLRQVDQAGFAVVGSRNATPGGLQNAESFSRSLSEAGLTIVSGMALGIDAAAHRGGLAGAGSTIAVVGTGLDLVYPAKNKSLAHEIAERGLVVSEFALGTPALAQNFPRRNRIISGLARGVLVVEAAIASGSLITARQAGEQGREVFAIPGSIHSPFSKGCHQLIKQGAKLVEDAADILQELQMMPLPQTHPQNEVATDPVLDVMGFDPVSVDTILERSALAADQVMVRLTELELAGAIASLPGGKYQRLR